MATDPEHYNQSCKETIRGSTRKHNKWFNDDFRKTLTIRNKARENYLTNRNLINIDIYNIKRRECKKTIQ